MNRLWRWMGLLVLCAAWHGGAWSQHDVLARLDAIYLLSEQDNVAALEQMRVLGESLDGGTPYPVQREYLSNRIAMELDSDTFDGVKASIARLQGLAQAQRDDAGMALAMAFDAATLLVAAQSTKALARLDAAQPLAQRSADPAVLWQYYLVRSNAELNLGKFELALDSALKCLQYADQHPRHARQSRLRAFNLLGTLYGVMKNYPRALAANNEGLALAKALDSRKMMALLYMDQGNIHSALGHYQDSIASNANALKASRNAGLPRLESNILNNMSDGYLRSHAYAKAEALARQVLAMARARGAQGLASTAQANLGFALIGQGRIPEGAAEVRAALKRFHAADAIADEEDVLGELGRMYEQRGFYREALATVREQQHLSVQLFRADREKAVASLQEQFDAVQRLKKIELLERDNSLKDADLRNQRLKQAVTLLGALVALLSGLGILLLYRRVHKTNEQLRDANQQLAISAVRDPLTGLNNRRAFLDLMGRRDPTTGLGRREGDSPDGLMILDIDHFKTINDTRGHAGGDAVLVEIAKRLRAAVRDSDMVMRWGGEEFLVYSPKASAQHLQSLARRVLKAVGEAPMLVGNQPLSVTVTAGFVLLPFSGVPETECNWERALQLADTALYLGKVNGRNRAYGLNRLLVPFAQAIAELERDISAALTANLVEWVEVLGPQAHGADVQG